MMVSLWSPENWLLFGALVVSLALIGLALWHVEENAAEQEGAPLDIAQRRYTRGEISRHEYEEMRRVLSKPAHFSG